MGTDPVEALFDLVLARSAEAAQGRAFSISIAGATPGAPPLAEADRAKTLAEAGLGNTLLMVSLKDS